MRVRFRNVEPQHDQIIEYLQRARLNEVASIMKFHLLPDLISALVEHWRPECHTFHFPYGECTVTQQDVALHLGLPINGLVVIGTTDLNIPLLKICVKRGLVDDLKPRILLAMQSGCLGWRLLIQHS